MPLKSAFLLLCIVRATGGMFHWPQKPDLLPHVVAELEQHGVGAMRDFLAAQEDHPDVLCKVGYDIVRRGEIEDWLKWKKELGPFRARVVTTLAAAMRFLLLPIR